MKNNKLLQRIIWNSDTINMLTQAFDDIIAKAHPLPDIEDELISEVAKRDKELANDRALQLAIESCVTLHENSLMELAFKMGVDFALEMLGTAPAFGILPENMTEWEI